MGFKYRTRQNQLYKSLIMAVKLQNLKSTTTILINGVVEVELNVRLVEEAKGDVNKSQFNAIQSQINDNFLKAMNNIVA